MATITTATTEWEKGEERQPPERGSGLHVGKVPAQKRARVGADADAGFGYQGGPIIQSPDVYVSFWGNSWNDPANATTRSNLVQFVQDFLASNYMNILSQYSVGQGAGHCGTFRSQSVLTTVGGDPSDSDIHNSIQTLINNGSIPEPVRRPALV